MFTPGRAALAFGFAPWLSGLTLALCMGVFSLSLPAAAQQVQVPEDIQALVDKAAAGAELTEAEQERMRAWAQQAAARVQGAQQRAGTGPRQPAPGGSAQSRGRLAGGKSLLAGVQSATPTEKPGLRLEGRKLLTRGQYLALVKQCLAESAAALPAGVQARLDAVLASQTSPGFGGNLGALLSLFDSHLATPAYVLAHAALRTPEDVLVASNLGVALKNARFYERAYDVLSYADALEKNQPVILTNRAYAAMYLGDLTLAKRLLNASLEANPRQANAHTALALIARARGDAQGEARAAQAALACGYSAVSAAQAATSRKNDESRADDTPLMDRDAGYGLMGAGAVQGGPPARIDYPIWYVDEDPAVFGRRTPSLSKWVALAHPKLLQLAKQRDEALQAYQRAHQEYLARLLASGQSIPRVNARVLLLLEDLANIYEWQVHKAYKPLEQKIENAILELPPRQGDVLKRLIREVHACESRKCEKAAQVRACRDLKNVSNQFHKALGQQYLQSLGEVKQATDRYFAKSSLLLEEIADPLHRQARFLERRYIIEKHIVGTREAIPSWANLMVPLTSGECEGIEPVQDEQAEESEELVLEEPESGECRPPPGELGLGAVSLSYDCEGFTLQGGEGYFAGLTVKYKGPSGHHETTIFAGIGSEVALGKAKGEAKAVLFLTQAQGAVVDTGAIISTEVSAEGLGSSLKAGTELKISMRAGPEFNGSASASFAGESLGEVKF